MTDKLAQYNGALIELSARRLRSLSEQRESRRVLDSIWDKVTAECLEAAFWKFIKRTIALDASTTIEPAFGYNNAFRIPNDWVRTVQISSDERFAAPLLEVKEEAGYWYANVTPLYISYNSNDPSYGMNLGEWPATFARYHELQLAERGCKRITGSDAMLQGPKGISEMLRKAKKDAEAKDAMNDPVGHAPAGTWVRSRRGFGPGRAGFGGSDPGCI